MDTDKHMGSGNLPDDIMLSSAEDLNNDGSFMGASESLPKGDREDEKLDRAVAELLEGDEPEDAQIDPEYPEEEETRPRHEEKHTHHHEHRDESRRHPDQHSGAEMVQHNRQRIGGEVCQRLNREPEMREDKKPVVMMPGAEPVEKACTKRSCGAMGERVEDQWSTTKAPARDNNEPHTGINKAALIWMIILTIVLGGVIGIMIYAFIIDRIDATQAPEPDPDTSLQDNLNAVAGALEVYLTEVNLDNYNTDIVLVNGGGAVSLKGTLKHSVFVNATSDVTLVLNGVTIESEEGAAIVNLNGNALTMRVDGMNTLLANGGGYGAALYSNGKLTIRGSGQVMIYSSGAGSRAIATKNGYLMDGAAVVALGQSGVERPLDDSTQAYFAKDLTQVYRKGTMVSASDESGVQVVRFTAPGDFSSIFVSNSKLADGVQYSITLGGGGTD